MEEQVQGGSAAYEGMVVQPLLLTIPQVMRCMGLGRNKVYDLIHKEGLPIQRFGRAVRVSPAALEQWLEQRTVVASCQEVAYGKESQR